VNESGEQRGAEDEAVLDARENIDDWLQQVDKFVEFLDTLGSFWGPIGEVRSGSLRDDTGIEKWRRLAVKSIGEIMVHVQDLKGTLTSWKREEEESETQDEERLKRAAETLKKAKEEFEQLEFAYLGVESSLELCIAAGYKVIARNPGQGWRDRWRQRADKAEDIALRIFDDRRPNRPRSLENNEILKLKNGSGRSNEEIKAVLDIDMEELSFKTRISRLEAAVTLQLILELAEENGLASGFEKLEPVGRSEEVNLPKSITFRSPSGTEVEVIGFEIQTTQTGEIASGCFYKLKKELERLERTARRYETEGTIRVLAMLNNRWGIIRFYNVDTRRELLENYREQDPKTNPFVPPPQDDSEDDPDELDSSSPYTKFPPVKTLLEAVDG